MFETQNISITALVQKTSKVYCYENAKPLHKAVIEALTKSTPDNMIKLALENPSVATDGTSVAYYQTPDKIGKTRTVSKPGKYLRRHFPKLSDTDIRDIIACTCTSFTILTDMDKIIDAVMHGPYSCMKDHDSGNHPYRVYSARFGWSLAIRKNGDGKVIGRALLNSNTFVRSFTDSHNNGEYARGADAQIEALLIEAGYKKCDGWGRYKLEKIELYSDRYIMPYIDGGCQSVDDNGDYWVISRNGEYSCRETQGYISIEDEDMCTCEHCGARVHQDDMTCTINDRYICESCADDMVYVPERRYTVWSNGREQTRYTQGGYADEDDCIEVDGEYYLKEGIDNFDIVECEDGEYRKIDDCIFDEDSQEYYASDSEYVKFCEDDQNYHTEFWECSVSGEYYSNNEDYVVLDDGEKAHPDNAWKCSVTNAYYSNDDTCYQVELKNGGIAHYENCWVCEVSGNYFSDNEYYIIVKNGKAHASSLISYSA